MPKLNPRALEISHRDSGLENADNSVPATVTSLSGRERQLAALKPWQFQPGKSGNPGGKPKRDIASEISRAIFEENTALVYEAQAARILSGDPYAFKEHADRAYGKLKDKLEVSGMDEMAELLSKARKRLPILEGEIAENE